jgi:hypothetical protein
MSRIQDRGVLARLAALALLALSAAAGAAPVSNREFPVAWQASVEVAAGRGVRGAWQQNESRYDYVDDPTVALHRDGAAAVAWVDQRSKDVYFQVYERSGAPRFARPVNVSRTPRVFSWLPRIVVSPLQPRDVFIVWQEIVFSGGSHGGDIFFARSRDGGRRFDAPINLSNSVPGDGKGRINRDVWHNGSLDLAIGSSGTLYAAWTEYDGPLWFTRSTDRGTTFEKPVQIASAEGSDPARAPALAAGADNEVYLAWTVGEDGRADIRIARSQDGGRTFGEPAIVARTDGYSDAPKIAVDSRRTLHVVHAESAGGPFDRHHVRYTRSRDGARTFEPARELSSSSVDRAAGAAFPALSIDSRGNVYVLWDVYPKPGERPRGLALAVSRDGGATFTRPHVVPGSSSPDGGFNGSQQGLLMRKLAVNDHSEVVVVNSSFRRGDASRVWLMRGALRR